VVAEQAPAVGPEYERIAAFFDAFAPSEQHWRRRNRTYYRLVERICRFLIPPGGKVLEIGCGSGDLLAALEPADGVGVDVSGEMVELARSRHPSLRFDHAAGERLDLGETYDFVVLGDLLPYVHDLLELFARVAEHSHAGTRVVIHSYSRAWKPLIRLAEILRLKPPKPLRNWVSPEDVRNLLDLADFEVVTLTRRILMPKSFPLLSFVLNGLLANLWPFNHLCLTYWIVARPRRIADDDPSVSVVCPCRNERGNVAEVIRRLPDLGPSTELIFVEGGSSDGTAEEIERQIALHPDRSISLLRQSGRGKGDAVREGFRAARNEVLMILDGDLSVRPEDLEKFYRVCAEGRAELVNGSRLVYDVEPGAMRFVNMLGNKTFGFLFEAMTGQSVKDTLCGTKVLRRSSYERIAASRSYFGDFDPFGDFDLLFGAARLNMKIADMPVRYQARTYGSTNISRWRHGWLLVRMTALAFWKFRVAPVALRS
jgi:SAM-dependent methyltransferase